jgi:hypothetical protein
MKAHTLTEFEIVSVPVMLIIIGLLILGIALGY